MAAEYCNIEKFATTLSAEGGIPHAINGEPCKIIVFEMVRKLFRHPYNFYLYGRLPWNRMDYPLVAKQGAYYSTLTRFCLCHPKRLHEVVKGNLMRICRRWVSGTEIIEAHLDPKTPIVKGNMAGNIMRLISEAEKLEKLEESRKTGESVIGITDIGMDIDTSRDLEEDDVDIGDGDEAEQSNPPAILIHSSIYESSDEEMDGTSRTLKQQPKTPKKKGKGGKGKSKERPSTMESAWKKRASNML